MLQLKNNEESWEMLHLASGIYNVGDPLPDVDFHYHIVDVSERNAYCSNSGIERQIHDSLELNPDRKKVVYFYYKLNSLNGG